VRLTVELQELSAQAKELNEQLRQIRLQESRLVDQLEKVESEIKERLQASEAEYADLSEAEFQAVMAELGDPMRLTVEVVYATRTAQFIKEVQLPRGANIEDGIMISGVLEKYPDIDLSLNSIGIHGVVRKLSDEVADGDRIEIYRAVVAKA
jgi:hypothetical protein